MRKGLIGLIGCTVLLLNARLVLGVDVYTLENYLKDVSQYNHEIQASVKAIKGYEGTSQGASLGFSPMAFTKYTYTDDKADSSLRTVGANESKNQTLVVGLSQQFRYGFNLNLNYSFVDLKYDQTLDPQTIPEHNFVSFPSVTLKVSLWQDVGGRSLRSTEDAAKAGSMAKIYGERFKIKMNLYQAELTYWGLALSRRMVEIQEDNLSRAKKQLDWTTSRYNRSLADSSDLVQIEALVKNYELALEQAKESVRSSSISFNTMRGSEKLNVPERLQVFDNTILEKLTIPAKVQYRDDVKASLFGLEAARNQAKASKEKLKPSLEFNSTYSLKNTRLSRHEAFSDSFDDDAPTWTLGLSLSTPLDFWLLSKTRAGYENDVASSKENFDKLVIDQRVEWQNYLKKLDYSKQNLKASTKLKDIQKTKLQYEKDKYNKGRTTLFQVLSYETEYATSTATELSNLFEVVKNYAYLRTYAE